MICNLCHVLYIRLCLLTHALLTDLDSSQNCWIRYVSAQARNQLGTPGGAKSVLRAAQIYKTMSNTFKQYPTYFFQKVHLIF